MVGIDEVGRGSWAGPLLVVAAKAKSTLPVAVRDSKTLSKKQRELLYEQLESSCSFGEGWVEPNEIDELGLTGAMKLGVARALSALSCKSSASIIMDGTINYCGEDYSNVTCIACADATHPIVSAASIYAKVKRDNLMTELAQEYPGYGFDKHVGYGTKMHLEGLKKLGISKIHRKSYKPVKAFA
jgi:ribonuclease HII